MGLTSQFIHKWEESSGEKTQWSSFGLGTAFIQEGEAEQAGLVKLPL